MNDKKTDTPITLFLLNILILTLLLSVAFTPAANASELIILYSNDIRGETEPCG
jgi:hypothetical protein